MLAIALMMAGFSTQGQSKKIRIVDESGSPIQFATVIVLPDSLVSQSDENGYADVAGNRVRIRAIGYLNKESGLAAETIILEPDPIFLEGVVVNELAVERNWKEFPGGITRIGQTQIRQTDQRIVTDLLNSVPGVYMQSGALNTNRITIRGIGSRSPFSTNKIRAYYEDIPLTNGSGETTIEDIDLAAIGAIEVIKGPNSSIYGSGLGGTINIKKVRPQTGLVVTNDFSAGSFGTFKETAGLSYNRDNKDFTVRYSKLHSDGYRDNNELDRNSIFLSGSLRSENTVFNIVSYYLNQKAYIPSSINVDDYRDNPRTAAFTWAASRGYEDYDSYFIGLSADHSLSASLTLKSSVYHSLKDNYEPRPFNILDDGTISVGTRNRLIFEAAENLSLMGGFELFRDWYDWSTFQNLYEDLGVNYSVEGARLSELEETRSYYNIFAQGDLKISDKWNLTAGLNLNRVYYDLEDKFNPDSTNVTSEYAYEPQLSPRIAVTYEINGSVNWFLSASHGFSPPSLEETLTPEGTVNSNLKPESGWNYETGFKGQLSALNFAFNLYTMRIENLLVGRRTELDQYIGINAGSTRHDGLEVAAGFRIFEGENFDLSGNVNYTLSNFTFEEFVDEENDYSGNELTGVPSDQLQLSIDFSLYDQFYLRPRFLHVNEIPVNDANDTFTEAYQVVDLQVGWKQRFGQFGMDIGYQGSNLLDEKYASMVQVNAVGFGGAQPRYYYPGLPINHMFRLRVDYSF